MISKSCRHQQGEDEGGSSEAMVYFVVVARLFHSSSFVFQVICKTKILVDYNGNVM